MPTESEVCAFCDRSTFAQRIVAENDLAFAFLSNIPIVPGHTLICSKRHARSYEALTQDEVSAIEDLRVQIKKAAPKAFNAEGFNYAWNEGEAAGQSIPHFHLHILPRKEGDAGIYHYEPRSFLYRPGSRAISPDAELVEVAAVIKNAL